MGAELASGDEVFAGPNSTLTLYSKASKSEYVVPAQTVYRVKKSPACEEQAELPPAAGGAAAGAGGAASGVGVALGVSTAVIAGGVTAIIISKRPDKGDKPTTPD